MKENEINIIKVDDDTFVGIRLETNKLNIYLPNLYNIGLNKKNTRLGDFGGDKSQLKKDIFEFLKTLSLATNDDEQGREFSKSTRLSSSAFVSMRWLIMDFVKNGFYEEFGKKSVKGCSGKINWKKTLKQIPRFLNDDIFFDTLIVDKKIKVSKIISEIYRFCLQLSIDCIGWIWGINAKVCENNTITPSHLGFYISVLKRELVTSFLDSKKEILLHLQNVLNGVDANSKETFVYGVKSYHTVYEKMIDKMFGNLPNISDYYPEATWHFANGETKSASNLRPDTIMQLEGDKACIHYYILDAKYYDCKSVEYDNHPTTVDIQKQITYGDYVWQKVNGINNESENAKDNADNIRNAFILPCDKETIPDGLKDGEKNNGIGASAFKDNLFYLGTAIAKWRKPQKVYEKIIGLYIDLKFLINNYQDAKYRQCLAYVIERIIKTSWWNNI